MFNIWQNTPLRRALLHTRLLFLLSSSFLFGADANAQAATVYQDEAAFLAVVSSPTLIDFEGIAAPGSPVFLGNPGVFTGSGVTIQSNSQMFVQNIDAQYGTGSFLSPQGTNPQLAQFSFPANTVAVGFSYSYTDSGSVSANAFKIDERRRLHCRQEFCLVLVLRRSYTRIY